jgi:hypothetical protein
MGDTEDFDNLASELERTRTPQEYLQASQSAFMRLSPQARSDIISNLYDLHTRNLRESIQRGKDLTLRDLNSIASLTENELKLLTLGAASYIAQRSERERLISFDAFNQVANYPLNPREDDVNRLRKAHQFITSYYELRPDMHQTIAGMILFDALDDGLRQEFSEFVTHYSDEQLNDLRLKIRLYQYKNLKEITEALPGYYLHCAK